MKTLHLKNSTLVYRMLLSLVFVGTAVFFIERATLPTQAKATAQTAPVIATFTVRSYSGKCLEFGSRRLPHVGGILGGEPVYIADCNGSTAQQVHVEELTDRPGRQVILRAGNGVLGAKRDIVISQGIAAATQEDARSAVLSAATAAIVADQRPLEVQPLTYAPDQIFVLDGDSIILAADRTMVVEVQRNRGTNRTPLVFGRRDLDASEFWDFIATDGSARRPTSGFVRVSQKNDYADGELRARADFLYAFFGAKAGTVIELDANVALDLSYTPLLFIPEGVTIRSDRRGTRLGAKLFVQENHGRATLEVAGNDVRITGLRLRGPSRSTDKDQPKTIGILAHDDLFTRTIIDHNELSDWPGAAVSVEGGNDAERCTIRDNRDNPALPFRQENVRVARNFIHHNQRQDSGYGVVTSSGAYVKVEGNTFASNRHAIAADGRARTAYRAWNNLVLTDAPKQDRRFWFDDYTHDFDMHGTNKLKIWILGFEREVAGFGGTGGEFVEIARNTFLGTGNGRENFDLRGEPCFAAVYQQNVSLQSLGDSIGCGTVLGTNHCGNGINKLKVYSNNQFNAPNPVNVLRVGDFDGDGREDLFLATGAAWYYAPAGQAEWRFLNARNEKIDQLLFGDFDGDKRTDVFTQHDGSKWDVSWGGASLWETINGSGPILGNAAIGDFNGDGRDDVFYADGAQWFVSYSGTGMFTHLASAAHRVKDLRFGDFNGDGKTDVFGVVGSQWMAVFGGSSFWAPLRTKLTNDVANLTVADFNGDGRDDIAKTGVTGPISYSLQISFGGTSDWTPLRSEVGLVAGIGRFNSVNGADVLVWSPSRTLNIASGGTGALTHYGRQDMR